MQLEIEAFRGVNDPLILKFDPRSHLTILYGENGSGKTTISDALEFVFHGSSGSLEEKSLDGKGRIAALAHALRNKNDLSVTWKDGSETLEASIDKTKALLDGTTSSRLHTLSRKNITSLIEETPAKRFTRIQEFVSVPAIEREEAQLKDFIKKQKDLQKSQATAAAQDEEDMEKLYQANTQDMSPQPARPAWLKKTLADSEETIAENLTIFSDLHVAITRLRDDFKPLQDSYKELDSAMASLAKEQEKLAEIAAESSSDIAEALGTLEQAKLYFEKQPTDSCPVCDTELGHKELTEKVSTKLASLKALTAQSDRTKNAQKLLDQKTTTLTTHQKGYLSIINKLHDVYQAVVDTEEWKIPPLVPPLSDLETPDDLTEEWFDTFKQQAADLAPLSEFVQQQNSLFENQKQLQSQLRNIQARRKDIRSEHDSLSRLTAKAESLAIVLHDERIRHANETLASISDEFARLYQTIHPGEEIENIRLYLHATQKGSARFDGTLFGNENMTPVACLSESHLDTLGLCLFLALQKNEDPENSIVYLDDAIASVDEAHMERLYHLILDEAKHFKHVIITSHYQPLRFKFRWGILTQKKVNFIELGTWSLDGGIRLAKGPNSEVSLLRKYLAAADDPSTIAGKSGIILEQMLDFLTGIYHCRLPRHPGAEQRWTLDNYRSGINNKLLAALRCDHLDENGNVTASHELAPLLKAVFDLLQIRNAIGCHYKELAGQFNELSEATKLGNATLALVDALCDTDNELPTSCKDGTSWTNRGTITRRLYPLAQPI